MERGLEGRGVSPSIDPLSSADMKLSFHSACVFVVGLATGTWPNLLSSTFSLFFSSFQTRRGLGFQPGGISGRGNHRSSATGLSDNTKPFKTGRPSLNVWVTVVAIIRCLPYHRMSSAGSAHSDILSTFFVCNIICHSGSTSSPHSGVVYV